MNHPDCDVCKHIRKHNLYGSLLHGLHMMAGCDVLVPYLGLVYRPLPDPAASTRRKPR